MATPIGHMLAGFAVSRLIPAEARAEATTLTLLCVGVAIIPDLDVLPGLVLGMPVLFHGGMSHSLTAALIVSTIAALLFPSTHLKRWQIFALCFSAYGSHLLLDFFNRDGREPFGIPLLWPFVDQTFIAPFPILIGMRHASNTTDGIMAFLDGVFSRYNILSVTVEVLVVTPYLWLATRLAAWPLRGSDVRLLWRSEKPKTVEKMT